MNITDANRQANYRPVLKLPEMALDSSYANYLFLDDGFFSTSINYTKFDPFFTVSLEFSEIRSV